MATVTNNAAKLTPSAVKVATSFNYVSSVDLVSRMDGGTTTAAQGIHKRDVDEQMIKRYGDQGITGLLELLGDKKETSSHLFEHYEEDFYHNNFTGSIADESGNQGTLSVSADDDDASGRHALRVGDLIQIASKKGKKQNKKIKLGICGEHGGDPLSIHFCSKIGLNYVSCSPYRVPIARLAAAQAELIKNN